MFGPDRFAFETPNVIDPGDAPPSRPNRKLSQGAVPSVEEIRQVAARLLDDDDDDDGAEYNPRLHQTRQIAGGSDDGGAIHDQLPSVEEARLYATSLLSASERRLSPSHNHPVNGAASQQRPYLDPERWDRTVKLNPDALSAARRRRRCLTATTVCGLLVALVFIVVGSVSYHQARDANSSDGGGGSDKSLRDSTEETTSTVITAPPTTVITAPPTTIVDDETDSNPPPVENNNNGLSSGDRFNDIVEFLSNNGISDENDLASAETAQYRGAAWMAEEDLEPLDVPTDGSYGRFVQRYVLAVMYFALGGPDWTDKLNFVSENHECSWYKIQHDRLGGDIFAFGISCDDTAEHVETILIPENNVSGSMPSELGLLTHLRSISFNDNAVTGSLPETLRHLTNMHRIDLQNNEITGTLPDWLGNLSALRVLLLSRNNLMGSLPNALAGLDSNLQVLALDDNAFMGDISVLGSLTNLEYLYVDQNQLTGRLDMDLFIDMQQLYEVDLSHNQLQAQQIPNYLLLDLPKLQVLDIGHNQLAGSFQDQPATSLENEDKHNLEYLCLHGNQLQGTIPEYLSSLGQLTHLDLGYNKFTGNIPDALGDLTSLVYLFVNDNPSFAPDSIPLNLQYLTHLQELSLANTARRGNIPDWLGTNLRQLIFLDLSNNGIQGDISKNTIWDLPNLSYLLLNGNGFTGPLPSSFASVETLQLMALHKNFFMGDVEGFCSKATILDTLFHDCSVTCTCCEQLCCDPMSEDECFQDELQPVMAHLQGTWEFNFTRTAFSFSPTLSFASALVTQDNNESQAQDPTGP